LNPASLKGVIPPERAAPDRSFRLGDPAIEVIDDRSTGSDRAALGSFLTSRHRTARNFSIGSFQRAA
jgi:hypothetical protein